MEKTGSARNAPILFMTGATASMRILTGQLGNSTVQNLCTCGCTAFAMAPFRYSGSMNSRGISAMLTTRLI